MVYPAGSGNAPAPHPDLPADPKADYEEARAIVDRSPRGATALLRLAVQKLCAALGEPGENINTDVASLVKKGLPPGVQEELDSLRVICNNAVHPGVLDLRDDRDSAVALFGLLDFIVEQMITRPKELQAIYSKCHPAPSPRSRSAMPKRVAKNLSEPTPKVWTPRKRLARPRGPQVRTLSGSCTWGPRPSVTSHGAPTAGCPAVRTETV